MPFISRGRTIGFKRISPLNTLESVLQELAKKGFIGRLVFDGVCPETGKVLLRIEVTGEKVVALEAEVGGRLYKGVEAVPYFERCLKKGEGFVEIIELDSEKVLIDLEDNPDAQVTLTIEIPEATLKIASFHAAAKGEGMGLLGRMLNDISLSECLIVEGVIDGDCDGVIKGEICPDSATVALSYRGTLTTVSKKEEFENAFTSIGKNCKMAELIMKGKGT